MARPELPSHPHDEPTNLESTERLLERVSRGEEMVLTQDGREFARIVPTLTGNPDHSGKSSEPWTGRTGWGAGMVKWISPDFDAPLEEFREYME